MDDPGAVNAVGGPDRAVSPATSHDDAKNPMPTRGRGSTNWISSLKISMLVGLLVLLLSVTLAGGGGFVGPGRTACSFACVALDPDDDAVNAVNDVDHASSTAASHDDAKTPCQRVRGSMNWISSLKKSMLVGLLVLLLSATPACTVAASNSPPPTQRVSSYGDCIGGGVLVGHGLIAWPPFA